MIIIFVWFEKLLSLCLVVMGNICNFAVAFWGVFQPIYWHKDYEWERRTDNQQSKVAERGK